MTDVLDQIYAPLNAARVPFSSTHGNHDNHRNISHAKEIAHERAVAPLSYTRTTDGVGGAGGEGCYWVPVGSYVRPLVRLIVSRAGVQERRRSACAGTVQTLTPSEDRAPALVLWFFDSRGGISESGEPLPDWVDESVAGWIERESKRMDDAWGPGDGRAALAFTHIPPCVSNSRVSLSSRL